LPGIILIANQFGYLTIAMATLIMVAVLAVAVAQAFSSPFSPKVKIIVPLKTIPRFSFTMRGMVFAVFLRCPRKSPEPQVQFGCIRLADVIQ